MSPLISGALASLGVGAVMASQADIPPGPLGRWTGAITAGVTIMALAFAFLTHVGAFGWHPDPFIDLVASVAVGVVFGRGVGISEGTATTAGALANRADLNTRLALAAHERLDMVQAPPVSVVHPSTTGTAGVTVEV